MLIERGVKPEQLPPGEDLKKVQRRLDGDQKKVAKEARKIKRIKLKMAGGSKKLKNEFPSTLKKLLCGNLLIPLSTNNNSSSPFG